LVLVVADASGGACARGIRPLLTRDIEQKKRKICVQKWEANMCKKELLVSIIILPVLLYLYMYETVYRFT
jgi:hypothetical protein